MIQARTVIAIPVHNEEAAIGPCLQALARQTIAPTRILLLLNNCTDNTAAICHDATSALPELEIIETTLPAETASAGQARRLALDAAAALAGPNGIVLTTDADATPAPRWLEQNLFELSRGLDAVCGAAAIDPTDEQLIRPGLRFDDLREAYLRQLLDELHSLADPDPFDPWPRHTEESGATIALTTHAYHRAGGAPAIPAGEDRALIARLRLVDCRIRHAPEITVRVSGRQEGRARGGMADTIKRRIKRQDELTDEILEPAIDALRRATARARARHVYHHPSGAPGFARDLLIPPPDMERALSFPYFGAAWAEIERLSPVLHRRRVPYATLARETRQALLLRAQLTAESLVLAS